MNETVSGINAITLFLSKNGRSSPDLIFSINYNFHFPCYSIFCPNLFRVCIFLSPSSLSALSVAAKGHWLEAMNC